MREIYDLCIVGAGFFGCAAARHASANPGLKICLVGLDEPKTENEYETREIYSSNYDEGRILRVLSASPSNQILSRESLSRFRHIEKLSGIKFYNPVGYLNIGKINHFLMKNVEDAAAFAKSSFVPLFGRDIKKLYPFLEIKSNEYAHLDKNGAGIISARKMIAAEKKIALMQGCRLLVDKVTNVEDLVEGVHEIETENHGKILAKRVLITTGPYINANKFKVLPKLPMKMFREMAVLVKVSPLEADRLKTMPGAMYKRDEKEIGHYILPPVLYPDGEYYLKIGSMQFDAQGMETIEEAKEWFLSKDTVPKLKEDMIERLLDLIPDLKILELSRKICITSESESTFPIIDQVSPTVTVAAVGNGWGSTTAEEVGRLASTLSLTGLWDSEIPKSLFEIRPTHSKL